MDKPIQVLHVYGDDWESVYINGELILDGHSFYAKQVIRSLLRKLDIPFEVDEEDKPQEWWDDWGGRGPAIYTRED